MTTDSLTGTKSFAARLLRSERWRVVLLALALLLTLLGLIVRRAMGSQLMAVNAVFFPTIALLLLALVYQGFVLLMVSRKARGGAAIAIWEQAVSVAVDLATPLGILLIFQLRSPLGPEAALSAPALLLIPFVVLLSVLRLHPRFTFCNGMAGALGHLALSIRAVHVAAVEPERLAVLYSYSVLLAATGAAAAVVSWMVRRYVIEAVAEATSAERSQRAVETIEQDLRVARDIQRGLLPTERPVLHGFDVAGMARPAELTGGDYYDWQPLPDGRLVVAIADVTGHGIGPALVMAVCRAYARASAPTSAGPDALMNRLNDLIFDDLKGARFITMVLAIASDEGGVQLISAGHGPTLLFHAASRQVKCFGGDGLPLGILRGESYGPHRLLQLETKDVLLMLTDGFFEHSRHGDQEQFGIERLTAALLENAEKPAEEIIGAIDQAVRVFARGASQADDMTAVVIKRN